MKDMVLLVWAWIALAAGVAVLLLVVLLFNRIVRPALEIKRYADDVLAAGLAIARNLDGIDEAVRTRDLATAVPELALAYLEKLGAKP
jgi:type II secretory pathway component PulM